VQNLESIRSDNGVVLILASIRTSFELATTMVVGFVRLNSFDLGNERD